MPRLPRALRGRTATQRPPPLHRAGRTAVAVGLPDDRDGAANPAAEGPAPLGIPRPDPAAGRVARPEPRRDQPRGLRRERAGPLLGRRFGVRGRGPDHCGRCGPDPPRRPGRGRAARPLSGGAAPLGDQATRPRGMSLPATSSLPSRGLVRPLLTLSVAILGLVALAPLPAHAFESKAFGDVVVEPGETESDVSTAVGDVTVEGVVEGDVRSGRGDIEVNGEGVRGDINAGFGDVEVHAPVGGEIDAGFGDVDVDATV